MDNNKSKQEEVWKTILEEKRKKNEENFINNNSYLQHGEVSPALP